MPTTSIANAEHYAWGEGLHVPPGAAHQMRNESGVEVGFLVVSSPKSHGDREPALADASATESDT